MRTSVKFAAACAGCDGAPLLALDIGAPTASADPGARSRSVDSRSAWVTPRPVRASATPPWRSPAAPPTPAARGSATSPSRAPTARPHIEFIEDDAMERETTSITKHPTQAEWP
jgi:hypothetical protein